MRRIGAAMAEPRGRGHGMTLKEVCDEVDRLNRRIPAIHDYGTERELDLLAQPACSRGHATKTSRVERIDPRGLNLVSAKPGGPTVDLPSALTDNRRRRRGARAAEWA